MSKDHKKIIEGLKRRPWQVRNLEAARSKMDRSENILVSAPHCGSGKTFASLDAANEAFIRGLIEGLLVLVPRVNLAKQYELTWEEIRKLMPVGTMGDIFYQTNDPPIGAAPGQFGVVATYAQFVSKPHLFYEFVERRRAGLVLDEAQILGFSQEFNEGTKASRTILEGNSLSIAKSLLWPGREHRFPPLHQLSPFVQVLTGTPNRSDGLELILARYGDCADRRFRKLLADVEAEYLEGVKHEYLRPFEAHLCDGEAWQRFIDANPEQVRLSTMSHGHSRVIMAELYWKQLIEVFHEQLMDVKKVHPRFCGLIAACNQDHARKLKDHLTRRYPGLRVGLAISSDPDADANLTAFKQGRFDVIVTVLMAYVGFDHPWIRVICCLSAYREVGFLDQLFGRGLRVVREVPFEDQPLIVIAPGDRLMAHFVEGMRAASREGLRCRRAGETDREKPEPGKPCIVTDARMTDISAFGMNSRFDLAGPPLDAMNAFKKECGLHGVPVTKLAQLLSLYGVDPTVVPRKVDAESEGNAAPPPIAEGDLCAKYRSRIKEIADRCDAILMAADPSVRHGRTYQEIHAAFGIGNISQPSKVLGQILAWVEAQWLPYCEKYRRAE